MNQLQSRVQEQRLYVQKHFRNLHTTKQFATLYSLPIETLKVLALYINQRRGCILIENVNQFDKQELATKIKKVLDNTSSNTDMWGLTPDHWVEDTVGHPNYSRLTTCKYIHKVYDTCEDYELKNWTTYIGRETITDCFKLRDWLIDKSLAKVIGYRRRKRLMAESGCRFELKCWGLNGDILTTLTQKELDRQAELSLTLPTLTRLPPKSVSDSENQSKRSFWQKIPDSEAVYWKEVAECIQIALDNNMPEMAQEYREELDKAGILLKEDGLYRKPTSKTRAN